MGKRLIRYSEFARGIVVPLLTPSKMAFLNCLVRICRTFGKEVNLGYPIKWPTLSIEFTGLKHYCENLPGSFTVGWRYTFDLNTADSFDIAARSPCT